MKRFLYLVHLGPAVVNSSKSNFGKLGNVSGTVLVAAVSAYFCIISLVLKY